MIPMRYELDTIMDSKKNEAVHSEISELTGQMAEMLALRDWTINGESGDFYIKEPNGDIRMNEKAQDIWEIHYDMILDELYIFTNRVIEIDKNK